MLDQIAKLSKLEIVDIKNGGKALSVMFNPSSLSMSYETVFVPDENVGKSSGEGRFVRSRSKVLAVDLVIDGSAVSRFGVEQLRGVGATAATVGEQVKGFLDTCYKYNGGDHEPAYLRILWGNVPIYPGGTSEGFDCRLKSVDIKYTSFDRDGAPLRAELKAVFVESLDKDKQTAKEGTSSPDLSHRRVVCAGDTLPLLCTTIYGSARHHVAVARFNELDELRFLTPGQELLFPPTSVLAEDSE